MGSDPGQFISHRSSILIIAAITANFRLTVEGERPSNLAIKRIERRATTPRDISSRSDSVKASRDRRRGAGRMPPYGANWK
jgi:hypothetical protein